MRLRGLHNCALTVNSDGFTVVATLAERAIGGWDEYRFRGRVVVIDSIRPIGGPGLLFDTPSGLARCAVQFGGTLLRRALSAAGLEIVEVSHIGWEAPRPIAPEVLGGHRAELPACFVA